MNGAPLVQVTMFVPKAEYAAMKDVADSLGLSVGDTMLRMARGYCVARLAEVEKENAKVKEVVSVENAAREV